MLAFDAGKHVLCEKPLTLNLAEAEAMVAAAGAAERFLMEAMWMACNPVIRAVRDGLAEGRFGTPYQVHADLGFVVNQPRTGRLFNPELGGGALLDMGIYPLTFAHLMLGAGRPPGGVGDAQRPGRRPERRAGRPPRRGGLGADRVDDVGVAVHGHDRDR